MPHHAASHRDKYPDGDHDLPDFQKGARRAEGTKPDWCQCIACGRWWDDSIITGITPTPSGRCPFEYDHE